MTHFFVFVFISCASVLLGRTSAQLYRANRHVDESIITVWDIAGPGLLAVLCYVLAVLVLA